VNYLPITVAARSEIWTVFARSNTEIVYSVFVFSCVYVEALRRADPRPRSHTDCVYDEETKKAANLFTYLLTELSPSWDAANCAAIQEIPSNFKEPEGSSLCSQEPMLGGSLVTTAWRVLRLEMDGTASRYGEQLRIIE
jgi:hypothetical protein